jgi:uncharacterized membrane protein
VEERPGVQSVETPEYAQGANRQPILRRRVAVIALSASLAIIATYLAFPPYSILGKADLIAYGLCHRIPERSFFFAGQQLPLCARCTGTYLGAMLGFAFIVVTRRTRARNLPPLPVLLALIGFIALWGIDGLNSYLSFFPNAPHLYQPHNWSRLTTGSLQGLTLSLIVSPVFAYSFWRETSDDSSLRNFGELLLLLAILAPLILITLSGWPFLLYPLALITITGVLVMLGAVNTMIVLIVARQEATARTWREGVVPAVVGLALAFLEIGAMDLFRYYFTLAVGLPF